MTGTGTRRQRIAERLDGVDMSFDELRREFEITVRSLEDDLRHIERSMRGQGRRLRIDNSRCLACGFSFTKRSLHPPGRCPECRERRVAGPWFRID